MHTGLEYIKFIDFQIIRNLNQIEDVKNEKTSFLFSNYYVKWLGRSIFSLKYFYREYAKCTEQQEYDDNIDCIENYRNFIDHSLLTMLQRNGEWARL